MLFLDDKDTFFGMYVKQLAERLLFSKNPDLNAEQALLDCFKKVINNDYVNKINQMIMDRKNSILVSTDFENFSKRKLTETSLDFQVALLTAHHWPASCAARADALSPFPALAKQCAGFEKYYVESHQKKKLEWMHQLSRGILSVKSDSLSPM